MLAQRSNKIKRRRIILVSSLAGVAVVFAICKPSQREPVYQGRNLSSWIMEANSGSWPRPSSPADDAIRQIGTNGFPMITQLLRFRDSAFRRGFLNLFYKQSLIRFRISTQQDSHTRALTACWALGPAGKGLVPEVASAFKHMDPYFRPAFENWLQSLGSDADEAVPALIAVLGDAKNPTRITAAQTLGEISMHRQPEVVPVLEVYLHDTNPMVRFWSAEALKNLKRAQPATTSKVP
jgi:hypothetical protein